jgi:hypothetical protein
MSAQGFIDKHKRDIWDTCKVFELLGLAVPDGRSPLNWRPTSDLIDLIAPLREAREAGPAGDHDGLAVVTPLTGI